jgi:hypothetical protein
MATVKNCIMFDNFTSNAKFFGEGGDVHNQQFLPTFLFGRLNLMQISGSLPSSNTRMNGNIMMGTPSLSYQSKSNVLEYFINNTVVNGGFGVGGSDSSGTTWFSVFTNNSVFLHDTGNGGTTYDGISYFFPELSRTNLNMDWDHNHYYLGSGAFAHPFYFRSSDASRLRVSCQLASHAPV